MVTYKWNVERAEMGDLRKSLQEMMLSYGSESAALKEGHWVREQATYPVFIIDSHAQFAKTAHPPASDEVEDISVRHPCSPSRIVGSTRWASWNPIRAVQH